MKKILLAIIVSSVLSFYVNAETVNPIIIQENSQKDDIPNQRPEEILAENVETNPEEESLAMLAAISKDPTLPILASSKYMDNEWKETVDILYAELESSVNQGYGFLGKHTKGNNIFVFFDPLSPHSQEQYKLLELDNVHLNNMKLVWLPIGYFGKTRATAYKVLTQPSYFAELINKKARPINKKLKQREKNHILRNEELFTLFSGNGFPVFVYKGNTGQITSFTGIKTADEINKISFTQTTENTKYYISRNDETFDFKVLATGNGHLNILKKWDLNPCVFIEKVLDFDGNGLLDVFISYQDWGCSNHTPRDNTVYSNLGNGTFVGIDLPYPLYWSEGGKVEQWKNKSSIVISSSEETNGKMKEMETRYIIKGGKAIKVEEKVIE